MFLVIQEIRKKMIIKTSLKRQENINKEMFHQKVIK